jgi:hypothetical protein
MAAPRLSKRSAFRKACGTISKIAREGVYRGLLVALPLPLALWIVRLLVIAGRARFARFADHKLNHLFPILSKTVRMLYGLYLFVSMWLLLAFWTLWRASILSHSGKRTETTWGFGQILALATWVPVVVDFVYSQCCKCYSV